MHKLFAGAVFALLGIGCASESQVAPVDVVEDAEPSEPSLIDQLRAPDYDTVNAARHELFRRGTSRCIALLNHPDPKVRSSAAQVLGWYRDPANNDALISRFDDPDRYVRMSAIYSVGSSGDASRIPEVERKLADRDPSVQSVASEALWRLRRTEEGASE
jgi:HEAT repeat protein